MRTVTAFLTLAVVSISPSVSPASAQDAEDATEIGISQLAVPNGEIVSISPDGHWLLAEHPLPPEGGDTGVIRALQTAEGDEADEPDPDEPKLCVYAFDSLVPRSCTAPDVFEDGPGRLGETIAWAPDGSSVLFSEGSPVTGRDGDLWSFDAAAGALTDLTDDGFAGDLPFGEQTETPVFFDTQPAFSPDGATIAFVLSGRSDDEPFVTGIALFDLASGEVTTLAQLPAEPIHTITGNLSWAPDGGRIWFTTSGIDETTLGLWSVGLDGSGPERITEAAADREAELQLLEVDPAGELALVAFPRAMNRLRPPFFGLIDLSTGDAISFEQSTDIDAGFVSAATFAPDGRLVLLERIPGGDQSEDDVRLLARPPGGTEFSVLANGLPEAWVSPNRPGLTVLPDGRIAYPSPREEDLFPWTVVAFGNQVRPANPQPGSSFVVGATVVTTVETPLRAMPSADGLTVLLLPAGAELVVIDVSVEIDGIVWWPVREPESGALGYIPQAYLVTGRAGDE
jgi:hypothetical protein